MKIGFILGSFDPIHIGHIAMATEALNAGLVDKVLFVVAKKNVWKEHKATYYERMHMVTSAIYNIPNMEVSNVEEFIEEPCYSYKTIEKLKEQYPSDELYFIAGEDVVKSISSWKNYQDILKVVDFITVTRESSEGTVPFEVNLGYKVKLKLDISSTKVRYLLNNDKQVFPYILPQTEKFIKNNNLYK